MKAKPLYQDGDTKRELYCPNPEEYRTEFRRDYARLIHSPAFRRLQGKTQLFRGLESDFFRNRLTHSLEVAQIAKSIAVRINHTHPYFTKYNIDTDLVETAALAHDLGHPPFGHTGEQSLDTCMKGLGGFEGNAQTLRILARLEKKQLSDNASLPVGVSETGTDSRLGLNLTYRMLAAVLKYDQRIPEVRKERDKILKGYYSTETSLVEKIKKSVIGGGTPPAHFKTIECSIMDLSDDIAYSVYDLEDCFKAGFMKPLDLLGSDGKILKDVAERCSGHMGKSSGRSKASFTESDVLRVLTSVFQQQFKLKRNDRNLPTTTRRDLREVIPAVNYLKLSNRSAENGYIRTGLTARLVGEFVSGVKVKLNEDCPALSTAYLQTRILEKVEVLKNFTYVKMIQSPRLKVVERRGNEIVSTIFKALSQDGGHNLMPDDFRELYGNFKDEGAQKRVVCDFIAGMTDRYAVEFAGRLTSESAQTIFKPF